MKDAFKAKFLKFHRAVKEWITQVLFRKFLTPFILVVVYFFVLGPTSVFARIFLRSALNKSPKSPDSNWIETDNFEGSKEDSFVQS